MILFCGIIAVLATYNSALAEDVTSVLGKQVGIHEISNPSYANGVYGFLASTPEEVISHRDSKMEQKRANLICASLGYGDAIDFSLEDAWNASDTKYGPTMYKLADIQRDSIAITGQISKGACDDTPSFLRIITRRFGCENGTWVTPQIFHDISCRDLLPGQNLMSGVPALSASDNAYNGQTLDYAVKASSAMGFGQGGAF